MEQSCQVWHYAITVEEKADLERVQKLACRVILGDRYTDYDSALKSLNLEPLAKRRDKLCLKFAKKSLKLDQTRNMFPLNPQNPQNLRDPDKYQVKFAHSSRLLNSTIPQLQRALNKDAKSR